MANRVVMDEKGMAALLHSEDGPVGRDTVRRTIRVFGRSVELCPVDDGEARLSLDWEVGRDEHGIYGRVGSNLERFIHIERGTGLYEVEIEGVPASPNKGRVITPSTKQALAFKVNGRQVVVASIKGMHAQPVLRPALDAFDED